jgi:2-methylcitrate dehydratase
LVRELEDYPGFFTKPMSWEEIEQKFIRLSSVVIGQTEQNKIIDVIKNLEHEPMKKLIDLLAIPGGF